MAREQGRVHAVDRTLGRPDERLTHELRPADDEDHLGLRAPTAATDLGRVDVGGLDESAPSLAATSSNEHWPERFGSTGRGNVTMPTISAPDAAAASRQSRPMTSKLTQTVRKAGQILVEPYPRSGCGDDPQCRPGVMGRRDRFNGHVHTGFVGIYSFELRFPENHSLKEKRMDLRSVKAQLTNRVGCSIPEIDHHDVWQRSRLTLSCVAREAGEADRPSTPPSAGSRARTSSSVT